MIARQTRYQLDRNGDVSKIESGQAWAPPYVILSRALVRHAFMVAPTGANRDELEAAAAALVAELGVFKRPGHAIEPMNGGRIRIWYWDDDLVEGRLIKAGLDPARIAVVPAPLLARKTADVELVNGQDGFEGRFWRGGDLISTLWWPSAPDTAQWSILLRGARQGAGTPPPPIQPSIAEGPRRGRDLFSDALQRFSPSAWLAMALVLLISPLLYQGGTITRLWLTEQSLERQLTIAEEPLGDFRSLRVESLEAVAEMERLGAFSAPSSVGPALAALSAPLTEQDLSPVSWRHRPGEISLEVSGEAAGDLAAIVSQIESDPLLENASIRRERNEILLVTADIVGVASQ